MIDLNSISNNVNLAPPRIIMHGPHGVGKTTFGASAPSSIMLPVEDGLGSIKVEHFPLLKSYAEVMQAIGALYESDTDFHSVVVDSLDWLEPIVWQEACRKHGWDNIETPGYGKGYLSALDQWRTLLEGLNALRTEKGMAIILIAHSEIKRFDSPESDPYDRYQIKLQARASALLEEWSDIVLFANFKTYVTKTDAGFNKKIARGTGTGERIMYTEERPAFRAKNRYSLPLELPLSWQALEDAIANQSKAA